MQVSARQQEQSQLFCLLTDTVVQGISVLGDAYITDVDNYTMHHVGPRDEVVGASYRRKLTPDLWYRFSMQWSSCSSILINISNSDVVAILIGQYGRFCDISEDCQINVLYGP